MILKYLKDQGGQFWGAFGQSYANALEKAKDRPLKEAMTKAQIGHYEALNKKMEMDLQQEIQQQAGVAELTKLLTTKEPTEVPTKIGGPVQGPVTEEGTPPAAPPASTMEMKNVEMTDPRVRAALLKSGFKGEVLSQAAKQAFPSGASAAAANGVLFGNWDDLNRFMTSPDYVKAFPQGSRTVMTSHGIQLQGINPVDVASNQFHADIAAGVPREQAFENYRQRLYGKGVANAASNVAGKNAQEAEQPILPMQPLQQPMPGQPTAPMVQGATPGYAGPMPQPNRPVQPAQPAAPAQPAQHAGEFFKSMPQMNQGETQAQYVQRLRKEAQLAGSALPAGLEDVLAKGGTLEYLENAVRQSVTKPDGTVNESLFSSFAGPTELEYRQRFGKYGAYVGMGDVSPSDEELVFRQNLQSMKNLIVYLQTGKQINETEAARLEAVMPQAYNPKNFLASLDRFRNELNTIMSMHKRYGTTSRGGVGNVPSGAQSAAPAGKQLPANWEFTGK